MAQAEPGDLEELVHQLLQPQGLFQGDAGVAGPGGRADVRFVHQQVQIADHAGERGFQIVGQIDDQIVFSLLLLAQSRSGPQPLLPGLVQLILHGFQLGPQSDEVLPRAGQTAGGLGHLVQIAQRLAEDPAGNEHRAHPEPQYGQNGQEQLYDLFNQKHPPVAAQIQLKIHKVSPVEQQPACTPERCQHHRQLQGEAQRGAPVGPVFTQFTQWYTPLPRQF